MKSEAPKRPYIDKVTQDIEALESKVHLIYGSPDQKNMRFRLENLKALLRDLQDSIQGPPDSIRESGKWIPK